ncbi:hypothetical protein AB6A40_002813 [Gnathostoma spinigerum]|uniref:Uncharacterized protein n=1 Tax=Gnathostoma spinigerum TaxID=75299 RepID=A0ABD6ED74_9BILA
MRKIRPCKDFIASVINTATRRHSTTTKKKTGTMKNKMTSNRVFKNKKNVKDNRIKRTQNNSNWVIQKEELKEKKNWNVWYKSFQTLSRLELLVLREFDLLPIDEDPNPFSSSATWMKPQRILLNSRFSMSFVSRLIISPVLLNAVTLGLEHQRNLSNCELSMIGTQRSLMQLASKRSLTANQRPTSEDQTNPVDGFSRFLGISTRDR